MYRKRELLKNIIHFSLSLVKSQTIRCTHFLFYYLLLLSLAKKSEVVYLTYLLDFGIVIWFNLHFL